MYWPAIEKTAFLPGRASRSCLQEQITPDCKSNLLLPARAIHSCRQELFARAGYFNRIFINKNINIFN
jgi:hypothetical protein